MKIGVEFYMGALNRALADYLAASKKLPQEVLQKQGTKLAFALSDRLRSMTPGAKSITSSRLSVLKSGGGIHVRPGLRAKVAMQFSARQSIDSRRLIIGGKTNNRGSVLRGGKRLNIQALAVKAELALREKGRGYLGYAARIGSLKEIAPGKREKWFGRYKQELADAGLELVQDGASLEMRWLGKESGVQAGDALNKPRMQAAIAGALNDVTLDMQEYINRKNTELAEKFNA